MGEPSTDDLKVILANRLKNTGFTDAGTQHKWVSSVEVTTLVGWLIDTGHVTAETMFDKQCARPAHWDEKLQG